MSGKVSWRNIAAAYSFRHLSMQKKLAIVFIFLIILPITAANYFAYLSYSRLIAQKATDYTLEISSKMINKLEDYVGDMKRITEVTQYYADDNDSLPDYLKLPGITLEKQTKIEYYLQILNNMKKDTNSIYIFDLYGNIFYNFKSLGIRNHVMDDFKNWKAIAEHANGAPVLISTQEISRPNESPFYLFSVVKEIKDLFDMSTVGTVVVDANITVIEDAVAELDRVTQGKTIIVDEHNQVIYDSDRKLIATNISDNPAIRKSTEDRGYFTLKIGGEPYIYTYLTSSKLGWKALVYIPLKQLQQGAVVTRNLIWLITVLIIVLALVISLFTSFTLTRPLRKMSELMKQVQDGNLKVSFNVKFKDEISLLGRNFNLMLRRIQELIDEVYAMQARKNQAEMEALQSQINPHFMYNTLETIRMTAITNDDEEVSHMAFILGKLLRYTINQGDETVTIRDELNHLANYMMLQNYRFSNKFHLRVDLDEDMLRHSLPKLVLQPIVENAIFHGLEEQEGDGIIDIRAVREADRMMLIIYDSGIGMSDETLQRLRKSIDPGASPLPTRSGIGLRNVNVRIKLRYGEPYGLFIQSTPGEGTKVTLVLPVHPK